MLQKRSSRGAVVVALIGELGSGKTTFVQKFAKAYGITEPITSPTFVILKQYGNFIHVDAYRITSRELKALGIQELMTDPKNIIFIEWANRVKDILPRNCITIHFEHVNQTTRNIRID